MSDNPLFSIITVVYNGEKYLEETIQCVLNQTFKGFEYIIIDGNSTDRTVDIIKKYANELSYWVSEDDCGIYDAMNKGINVAKGEFIGMINSDDTYRKDAFEIVAEHISLYPEVDVFFGNINIINKHLNTGKTLTYKKGKNLPKRFSIWHPTVFVKKSAYNISGLFDTSFKIAADYELLLRFYKNGHCFYYIDKIISEFREGGLSYYNKMIIKERFRLQKMHYKKGYAYINKWKNMFIFIMQKMVMKVIGEKLYQRFRYKFLYH